MSEVNDIVSKISNTTERNLFKPILGLLLIKFINNFSENIKIIIPEEAKWENLRTKNEKELPDVLIRAGKALEKENKKLQGIFTYFAFDDLKSIGLEHLWEIFNLTENNFVRVACTEEIAQNFFKILTEKNKVLKDYTSPECICDLIVELADPQDGDEINDAFMGLAKFLIKAAKKNPKVKIYGQDINEDVVQMAKIGFLFNRIAHWEFKVGDVLKEPGFTEGNKLKKFDIVMSNFPFLSTRWNRKYAKMDKYGRFKYGVKASMSGDWIFIQHMVSTLKEEGKALSVITSGALIKDVDKDVRKGLIEGDLIEAVIDLPGNLFSNTSIPVSILILDKNKDLQRKKKILFIDASNLYEKFGVKNRINKDQIKLIVDTYREGNEKDNFSKFVSIDELKENNYKLNSVLYLRLSKLKESLKDPIELKKVAISIFRGVQISPSEMKELKNRPDAKYGFVNVGDVQDDTVIVDTLHKVSLKNNRWESMYVLKPGDILITSRSISTKTAIVEDNMPPMIAGGNLICIRVDKTKVNPYFLKIYLDSPVGRAMIEGIQTGSIVHVLNPRNVQELKIPYLSLNTQTKIVETYKKSKDEYLKTVNKAKQTYTQVLTDIYIKMGLSEALSELKSE